MEQIQIRQVFDKEELLDLVSRMPKSENVDLSTCYMNGHVQFCDVDCNGIPIYLFDVKKTGETMHIYIAYISIDHREMSRQLMHSIKDLAANAGCEFVTLNSANMKSSYRRWLGKCGFEPSLITYKMEIK